jgi:hypothetical protein
LGKELLDNVQFQETLQQAFANHWKLYMAQTHTSSQDTTCYKAGIEYPTEIKL